MPKTERNVAISDDDQQVGALVESELLRSLRSTLPQAENSSIVLSARSPQGDLVGGLTASTSYGWLLIKTLWVAKTCRNQGVGGALMAGAEAKAKAAGCHGAWLDTSSPEAMRFYDKLGYVPFGQLENAPDQAPATHRRWFMKKAL